jgi:thymidylate kinase
VLRHLYPRPDVVVMLDAPAEVLLARKGEGTVDDLERRRRDYLALQSQIERFVIVDATADVDQVYRDVAAVIREAAGR